MAGNADPIYPAAGNCSIIAALTAADTTKDGTTLAAVWTAGTNGSRLYGIRMNAKGTNVKTLARVFLNNGGSIGTASSNALFVEFTLPATTLDEDDAQAVVFIPLNIVVPAGWKVLICISTAVAAGWVGTVLGADF